ncbi:MAG: hypothetical protein LRS43_04935, partial [Desulfurococcales archaeon]|nr:hypothetical protein [Desulfurococcales archaeon]
MGWGELSELLQGIIDDIDRHLEERDRVRESAIKKTRDIIRHSSRSISSLLKGESREALAYLK